jgi:hypothetical protein
LSNGREAGPGRQSFRIHLQFLAKHPTGDEIPQLPIPTFSRLSQGCQTSPQIFRPACVTREAAAWKRLLPSWPGSHAAMAQSSGRLARHLAGLGDSAGSKASRVPHLSGARALRLDIQPAFASGIQCPCLDNLALAKGRNAGVQSRTL